MENNKIDNDLSVFYNALYKDKKPNEWIEIRCIPKDQNGCVKKTWVNNENEFKTEIINLSNTKKYNIFAGVACRSQEAKEKNKSTKKECTSCSVLWADIDVGSGNHNKDCGFNKMAEAGEAIKSFQYSPDLIINSGGGFHLYWLIDKRANFPDDIVKVEYLNKQFAKELSGDFVHDISRIMRVPGTINYKYSEQRYCTIIKK